MAGHKTHISREHLHYLLTEMIRIRRFEEACVGLYNEQKIRGFLHLYNGEEAISVGVMQALSEQDSILATYREHGHALARGISMQSLFAEMFAKMEGCSGGRGGSMHLFDKQKRFYGGNAIVAGALPLAVGLAMADKQQKRNNITCCFFGEGAVAEGEFHESMNLAKLWQLPILFVCENNLYAMGTALAIEESNQQIFSKAASYGMAAQQVDGMNVVDVEAASQLACQAIRSGAGPQFLECRTYRFRGHSMFDSQQYRDKDEIRSWQKKGPIVQLSHWLQNNHQISAEQIKQIELQADKEIESAVNAALLGHDEPVSDLLKHVYAEEANHE
ncbi:pyruvate dehydrogenase (acetyl-transferring) E1 component subunit alpha [Vibrio sp. ZSDZ34]|uniref:Pyruvate dehydrogenase E1 component subunit alpha n=1 Tax=Vibrio gelatinilyticus TaxID=2893468 RepID=A0A9X1WB20_9VIBR|nr:pyruvate dehydrogenase (acetyl-transferring) E1 component subunit alpha [Vibrio gelatinilyticus]MCJ2377572.1 pyruvate dehydrogenase (acetyl-transferring) E1 component subunit alpha [Vibrio gelatinilyticus]